MLDSWGRRPIRPFEMNRSVKPQVTLYTRAGCHLCDVAKDLLLRHGLAPKEIDIDGDVALAARYGECVPVVVIDGRERFRGRVEERLLKRLLGS